jgi:hypothetical protein
MPSVKLNQKERKALLYIKFLLCKINHNKIRFKSKMMSDTFDIFSGYIQSICKPDDKKLFHYKTGQFGRFKYRVPKVNENKRDEIDELFERINELLRTKEDRRIENIGKDLKK